MYSRRSSSADRCTAPEAIIPKTIGKRRLTLAHAQLFLAKVEHRREPCQEVQASRFDFGEMCDQPCGEFAL
jgi:hypothetical protein